MPWVLAKDEANKDRLSTVMYNLATGISIGASLLFPFMPNTSEKVLAQMNMPARTLESMKEFDGADGFKVTEKPEILFARLDVDEVMEKVLALTQKDGGAGESAEPGIDVEARPQITIDDFDKVQLRIGEIIKCEEVPNSKKLLCSQVKMGSEVRQIVSGIRPKYSAAEMVGKKVVVVANLKPAKLAGVVSEGMLLCAEDDKGELALLTAEKDMPNGAEIG